MLQLTYPRGHAENFLLKIWTSEAFSQNVSFSETDQNYEENAAKWLQLLEKASVNQSWKVRCKCHRQSNKELMEIGWYMDEGKWEQVSR